MSSGVGAEIVERLFSLGIGIEGGLELIHQIARREPQEERSALRRDARISGQAPAAAYLEEMFANAHESSLPPRPVDWYPLYTTVTA